VARYLTAGDAINRAALACGLAQVADPFQSTDASFRQMVGLLVERGQDLVLQHRWPQLLAEAHITTIAGTTDYDLPTDFIELVPQSGWNRTSRFPLGGPLSVQEWQYLKAAVVGVTFNVLFRQTPTTMRLFPSPPADLAIYYEYQTRNWAISAATLAADGSPDLDAPTATDDTVLFEPVLVVRALKLAFLQAKGFDTTTALAEYQNTLALVMGKSDGAPRLSLNGVRIRDRFLDGANLPITGLGGGV
jgi:hypothetical protein